MSHDHSYKLLFSHPEMVADLLRGFVHEDWVAQLDFGSLEKVSGSFVADDLREREDDVIWRARWGDQWLYVYLLLEFQSTVDPFMAIRIMVYVGLLYQDLIRTQPLKPGERLPPVLPIVLYNGERPWNAAEDIGDLIAEVPGGLERYRPSLRYLLLDEGRYPDSELAGLRNLAAAVFRIENSANHEALQRALDALIGWLQAPEQESLRRSFVVWLNRVVLSSKLPGVEFPELNDLREIRNMLAERVKDWSRAWKQEARAEGREEGRKVGRQEGLEEGQKQGEFTMLVRLLELRFGPLDETARNRLDGADAETLLRWGERVLTASTLAEVFGE
jgi:predicted transposase/invertase (TIGR01784 family)